MSGGFFDYKQYHIDGMVEDIERIIRESKSADPRWEYSRETISRFYEAIRFLQIAKVYAHRIDWLLCGDDSEDSFHERLNEELEKEGEKLETTL